MIFNKWDNQKKKIQINTETPFICENNIKEDNKKCYKFYENIEDNESIKKYSYVHMDCVLLKQKIIYIHV